MEPIIVERRGYCGTQPLLPDGYTHFGTGYECLRKGVGVGKALAENRRLAPVILQQNVNLLPPPPGVIQEQPVMGNLVELPEVELPVAEVVVPVQPPQVKDSHLVIYTGMLIFSYFISFLMIASILQLTKPKFILNINDTISNEKLFLYAGLIALSVPFIILVMYYLYRLIR